jgi:hypothetical protein
MLYGQAFTAVYGACVLRQSRGPLVTRIMQECLQGLGVYGMWMTSETPVNPCEDSRKMTAHWDRITGWVLKDGEC